MAKQRARRSSSSRGTERVEYRFKIDRYTPDTIPMARLAEYMADLARIMGETEHVHFRRLAKGSAVIIPAVDWQAVPKVRARVHSVKRRQAPADVLRIADSLNEKLAADNTSATLMDPRGAKVIAFAGRQRAEAEEFIVAQPGELYGSVIVIGGKNDIVPIHLQDGADVHLCEASREMARRLAAHLFASPIAVEGQGRWVRGRDGTWEMRTFRINAFRELSDRPLNEIVSDMRAAGNEWVNDGDPLGELRALRKLQ